MQEVQSAGGLGTHDPAAKGRHQETYKDRLPHKAHSLTPVCPNPFYFSNGPRGPGSWKEKPEPWGSRDRGKYQLIWSQAGLHQKPQEES